MRLENISYGVLTKWILLHVIRNTFFYTSLNTRLRTLTPNYKTKYTASVSVATRLQMWW